MWTTKIAAFIDWRSLILGESPEENVEDVLVSKLDPGLVLVMHGHGGSWGEYCRYHNIDGFRLGLDRLDYIEI